MADFPLAIWSRLMAPSPELTPKVTPVPRVVALKVTEPLLVVRLAVSVKLRAVLASPRISPLANVVVVRLPAMITADGAVAVRPLLKVEVVEPPLPKVNVPVLLKVEAPAMLASPSNNKE